MNTVLPADFDGVIRFTNPYSEDFTGFWNSKGYTFKAMTTSPMIIHDATPVEVMHIRKKFAKELAEREFFKTDKAKKLESIERNPDGTPRLNSVMMANSYNLDSDLAPLIQKCLEPLPISKVIVTEIPKENIEEKLSKDEEGNLRTTVVDKKVSLKKKALEA